MCVLPSAAKPNLRADTLIKNSSFLKIVCTIFVFKVYLERIQSKIIFAEHRKIM